MMKKTLAAFAGISGFLAVALGAFGAHGLRQQVSPAMLDVWQTAVLYQMFHSLALIAVVLVWLTRDSKSLQFSAIFFSLGILLFSGSLYALVLTGISQLGAITPLGGLMFLAGWIALTIALLKLQSGRA